MRCQEVLRQLQPAERKCYPLDPSSYVVLSRSCLQHKGSVASVISHSSVPWCSSKCTRCHPHAALLQVTEMKKVVEQKQVVVAQAKTDCEELLVQIVQDKRVADEQEKQVGGPVNKHMLAAPTAAR